MPAPITILTNKKPAEATNLGGLDLVSTTIPLTPWKDRDNERVHDDGARV